MTPHSRDPAALLRKYLPYVVFLVGLFGIGITVIDDDGDGRKDGIKIVYKTPKSAAVLAPAGDLQTEQVGPSGPTGPVNIDPGEAELRDETPIDVSKRDLRQLAAEAKGFVQQFDVSDTPLPVGGAQNYSVTQKFTGGVWSDFGSVTPTMFCLHYTVSPNVVGWSDVYGIESYFSRTRIASSTYIGDFEGHLLQMIPLDKKSWTQGAMNPYCRASIEIIATGRETRDQWLDSNLIKGRVLSSLMRDVMTKYNLPLRFVDPAGCSAPPGYTDHNHMECGNDHTDVSPSFPFDELAKQLASPRKLPIIKRDRDACKKIVRYRQRRHGDDKDARRATRQPKNERRHKDRVKLVHDRGHYCTSSGKAKVRKG